MVTASSIIADTTLMEKYLHVAGYEEINQSKKLWSGIVLHGVPSDAMPLDVVGQTRCTC